MAALHANAPGFRCLCRLMAVLMATGPSLSIPAQAAEGLDLAHVLPGSCVVVLARPRQLLTANVSRMFPIEVLSAAGIQELGIDPVDAEQLVVSIAPPLGGPPNYVASATFVKPVQLRSSEQLTGHTVAGELNGQAYLKSQHPLLPSIYQPTPNTLLLTPEATLQQQIGNPRSGKISPDMESLLDAAQGDDLTVLVNVPPILPLIQIALIQADLPVEAGPFLEAPGLIRTVQLRLNLSGKGPTELAVEANNAEDAEMLAALIDRALGLWRERALASTAQLKQDAGPVQQALGHYQQRMVDYWTSAVRPQRDGNRFVLFRQEIGEGANALTTTAVAGVLVALLLPAVQAAREASRRTASMNNLKQIMLALLNYYDIHKRLPAHASYDDNGKPLLSWRVHILPMLEEQELYSQFHLDEPWDSEHNKQLVAQMPKLYLDPSSTHDPSEGKTSYLAVLGKDFLFNGSPQGVKFSDVTDGTSNTIAILQVDDQHAAIWTKPDDWQYDAKHPLAGLDGPHPGIFVAGFMDGSVRNISQEIDVEVFRAMLTVAGGEVIPLDP